MVCGVRVTVLGRKPISFSDGLSALDALERV